MTHLNAATARQVGVELNLVVRSNRASRRIHLPRLEDFVRARKRWVLGNSSLEALDLRCNEKVAHLEARPAIVVRDLFDECKCKSCVKK
jgi:hypothetical protein